MLVYSRDLKTNLQVWFNALIGILLNLLIFGGPVAIEAIFSIGAIAQYIAFILPVAIRVIFVKDNFRPGPFHLGKWSRACGFISVGWVSLIVPVLCIPKVKGPDPENMNWTALVYGAPMLFAMIWYWVDARKWFRGPKVIQSDNIKCVANFQVNVEHRMIGRPLPVDGEPLKTESPASGSASGSMNEKVV